MPDICGDTVGDRLGGSLCFLLAGDMLGTAPLGPQFYLGISQSVSATMYTLLKISNTLQAFPKESPIQLRYYSNRLQELLDTFPNMSQDKFGHFQRDSHLFVFGYMWHCWIDHN
jgi:hypothetical protein